MNNTDGMEKKQRKKEKKKVKVIEYCSKCGRLLINLKLQGHYDPYTGEQLKIKQCPCAPKRVTHYQGSEYHFVDDGILSEKSSHDRYLPEYYDFKTT